MKDHNFIRSSDIQPRRLVKGRSRMLYISGARLGADEKVRIALTKIDGIGPKKAIQVCYRLGISGNIKIKELTKYQIGQIEQMIGQDHVVHGELKRGERADIAYKYVSDIARQSTLRGHGMSNFLVRISTLILLLLSLFTFFYFVCILCDSNFTIWCQKFYSMLFGKVLHLLFTRMGCCAGGMLIAAGLCVIFSSEPSLCMMVPSGASGSGAEGSDPASSAPSNQPGELNPPLIDENTRRQELNDRLGFYWGGLSYMQEVRDSFVETQLQIERHIEETLVADGYSHDTVFAKRHQIRGFAFYPKGKAYDEQTYLRYLRDIRQNGTRQSVPYRRILEALHKYDLFL